LLLRMIKREEPPRRLLVGGVRLFARESTVGPQSGISSIRGSGLVGQVNIGGKKSNKAASFAKPG
ncbi:MAG: hypothetical protein NZ658_09090, partial [Pirellulales bacterium]|nr:hypothetical protein [Pirellulales bacterium]